MNTTYTLSVPEADSKLEQEVEQLLRSLCISGKLCGLQYLTYAVSKAARDPESTRYITKELYPEIAKRFHTTASCVERAIRTAVAYSWRNAKHEALNEVAGYHLIERPTNSEFIDFTASYIRFHN